MRLYGLKVIINDEEDERHSQTGEIITYKWLVENVWFLVRFGTEMETFHHSSLTIDPDFVREWEKNSINDD